VVWISVLEENVAGQRPSIQDMDDWGEVFDDPNIPVLRGSNDKEIIFAIGNGGWPAAVLIDAETMRVEVAGGVDTVAQALEQRLPARP